MSNVLIYLLSHSFLYKFGDVAEVGHWSIILDSVSVNLAVYEPFVNILWSFPFMYRCMLVK